MVISSELSKRDLSMVVFLCCDLAEERIDSVERSEVCRVPRDGLTPCLGEDSDVSDDNMTEEQSRTEILTVSISLFFG
jgi:hypothetical protein